MLRQKGVWKMWLSWKWIYWMPQDVITGSGIGISLGKTWSPVAWLWTAFGKVLGEGSRKSLLGNNVCVWKLCSIAFLVRALSMFSNNSTSDLPLAETFLCVGFCYSKVSPLLPVWLALLSLGNGTEYRRGEPTAREPGSRSEMERLGWYR